MAFDLVTILVIGSILELICVKFGSTVFYGAPFTCISFLMIFIAVVRWNLWGLLIVPLIVLATIAGGRMSELPYIAETYDYRAYISIVAGFMALGINVIFFKLIGTDKMTVSWYKVFGLILLDYVLFIIIQLLVYRLLTSHNLAHGGKIIYEFETKSGEIKSYNICNFGEGGLIYNLFGLVACLVGTLVLRSQGIVCNAKQKFVEDIKNTELDRLDRENFTIDETVNTDSNSGEIESDKDDGESSHSI